jgi:UDP-N-acetylglucosamine:LPS N-acetylglucosamine transferase
MLEPERLRAMSLAALSLGHRDAASTIARVVCEAAGRA